MNDGTNRPDQIPTVDESASAIRKQWESQRQELLDRIQILELYNENLERTRDRLEAEADRMRAALGKCRDYFNGERHDELVEIIVECKRLLGS